MKSLETFKKEQIKEKRERIYQTTLKLGVKKSLDSLTSKQMLSIVSMYDKEFFKGNLLKSIKSIGEFTTTARIPDKIRGVDVVAVASRSGNNFVLYYNINGSLKTIGNESTVGNLSCQSKLMCFLLAVEHELVHLWTYVWYLKEMVRRGSHSKRFKQTLFKLFKHSSIYHDLSVSK